MNLLRSGKGGRAIINRRPQRREPQPGLVRSPTADPFCSLFPHYRNPTLRKVESAQALKPRLAQMHELVPSIATVGFLENPNNPIFEVTTGDVLAAAAAIGLKIQILKAGTDREIDAAFVSLVQARTGALLV